VVLGQRLGTALDAQNTSRVTSVGLIKECQIFGVLTFRRAGDATHNVKLVSCDQADAGGATGNLFFVLGI
jgi:hypothetical protein